MYQSRTQQKPTNILASTPSSSVSYDTTALSVCMSPGAIESPSFFNHFTIVHSDIILRVMAF
jgi:hypothetical protein